MTGDEVSDELELGSREWLRTEVVGVFGEVESESVEDRDKL